MFAIKSRAARAVWAGIAAVFSVSLLASCTQEQENKISRGVQNWTGTNGVLEIYAGDKVVRRFLKIAKHVPTVLATACWMKI
jgi:uncharacterized lipoprotein YehR (DUF1307 family)